MLCRIDYEHVLARHSRCTMDRSDRHRPTDCTSPPARRPRRHLTGPEGRRNIRNTPPDVLLRCTNVGFVGRRIRKHHSGGTRGPRSAHPTYRALTTASTPAYATGKRESFRRSRNTSSDPVGHRLHTNFTKIPNVSRMYCRKFRRVSYRRSLRALPSAPDPPTPAPAGQGSGRPGPRPRGGASDPNGTEGLPKGDMVRRAGASRARIIAPDVGRLPRTGAMPTAPDGSPP